MIRAIIFDFFGVICSDEYWQFVKADRQTDSIYHDYVNEVNLGSIPWQAFVQKIAEATDNSIEAVNEMYRSERIDPRVVGLIEHLHNTHKTGLLTNAHHEFIDAILDRNDLHQLFDTEVISSRLGIIKPDPRIFTYALEQLGVAADEAIYVDDLERHVDAAVAVGMQTVLYEDFEQLQQALAAQLDHS